MLSVSVNLDLVLEGTFHIAVVLASMDVSVVRSSTIVCV